jgi:hypothetical protein
VCPEHAASVSGSDNVTTGGWLQVIETLATTELGTYGTCIGDADTILRSCPPPHSLTLEPFQLFCNNRDFNNRDFAVLWASNKFNYFGIHQI